MGEYSFKQKLDVATLLYMGRRDRLAIMRDLEHAGKKPAGSGNIFEMDLKVLKEIVEDYQRAVDRQEKERASGATGNTTPNANP